MIDELLVSYEQTIGLVRRAASDLTPEQSTAQPPGVPNHPVWTLGHLAHSAQGIAEELGLEPWLSGDWPAWLGRETHPQPTPDSYPPLQEVESRLEEAHRRVRSCLEGLEAEELREPLPDEKYRRRLPTKGHAALHILAAHTAFHAGQLMVWRRAMGLDTEPFM